MNYRQVIDLTKDLVKSFNPSIESIASHLDRELSSSKLSEDEEALVRAAVEGCFLQKAALKAFLTEFYADKASSISRKDFTLYMVLGWFVIFHGRRMGEDALLGLLSAEDSGKVLALMGYLCLEGEENLQALQAGWGRVYDLDYVEDQLLAPLRRLGEGKVGRSLQRLLSLEKTGSQEGDLSQTAVGTTTSGRRKDLTRPLSPNITKPRPQRLPEPERIEQRVTVHPVPSSVYDPSLSLAEVERRKEQRKKKIREETQAKYSKEDEFSFQPFRETLPKLLQEREREEREALASKPSAKKAPSFEEPVLEVRPTVASIIREEQLIRKRQEEQARLIRDYEWNLRDGHEFETWQREMERRDREEALLQVEARRNEAKQSAVEARFAVEKQLEENREVASSMREELAEKEVGRRLEQRKEREEKVERRDHIRAEREVKPREAEERALEERRRQKQEVEAESRQLLAQLEAEREAELEERQERVRRLQAEFNVKDEHVVVFDPTEVEGHGLLGEMSLLEMKERLRNNRELEERQREEKRQEILREKEKQSDKLQRKVALVDRIRGEKRKAAEKARALKQRRQEQEEAMRRKARAEVEEATERMVREKRERQEQERRKLRKEEEEQKRKLAFAGASKELVDRQREESLRQGRERQERVWQQQARESERRQGEVDQRRRDQLALNKKVRRREEVGRDEARRREVDKALGVSRLREEAGLDDKKRRARVIRAQEQEIVEMNKETKRYATRMNEYTMERGREWKRTHNMTT